MHACMGTELRVSIISCVAYSGICTRSGRLSVLLCKYLSIVCSYPPWNSRLTRTRSCDWLYCSTTCSSDRPFSFDRPCQNDSSTGALAWSRAPTSHGGNESMRRGTVVGGVVVAGG